MYHTDDTIAAIASAPGGAARGIVRLSGPEVVTVLEACFRPQDAATLADIRRPTLVPGTVLLRSTFVDELPVDLLLWPNDRSYTRQKLAELHTIGSPPLLAAVLAAVCSAGARLAEPGEFTLRAFLAGRIDLAQAEAVLGVIDAHDKEHLQTALAQLAGGLTRPLAELRESLVELLAHLEAGLDFVEEDIRFIKPDEIDRQLVAAAAIVARSLDQLSNRERRDATPNAVLVGSPNVGKSSLLNALAADMRALVANEPGTTRDYLTFTLQLDGVSCQVVDTAGVQPEDPAGETDATGGIGSIAGRLGGSQAEHGDVQLLCLDATRPLNEWERHFLQANPRVPRLVLLTKCDQARNFRPACPVIETSARSGLGLDRLRDELRRAMVELERSDAAACLTADRCGASLRAAGESLARALELNRESAGEELVGSELRLALDELSKVTGGVYTEDILDRVFSRFCIGK